MTDLAPTPVLGLDAPESAQLSESAAASQKAARKAFRAGRIGPYIGGGYLVILMVAAFLLPKPYDPNAIDANAVLKPPSMHHWFGTDSVGGDLFSRTVTAARMDVPLSLLGTAFALVIGVAGGLLVSTKKPWAERLMRGVDAFQALPLLIVTLALVTISGDSIWMVAVAMAMISGPLFLRLVRSQALALRESRFVEAAIACGASWPRVMFRYVLPNMLPLILAQTALIAGVGILLIASLSFLGIGIKPTTPSWGGMIHDGASEFIRGHWWMALFPGIAIFLCVMSFNLIGDGLRDRAIGRTRKGA
jgi:peptide/nickel transport system permease protein